MSFSDFVEGARALKEMDGKYIGNRPVKLRKSTWESREKKERADSGNQKGSFKVMCILYLPL